MSCEELVFTGSSTGSLPERPEAGEISYEDALELLAIERGTPHADVLLGELKARTIQVSLGSLSLELGNDSELGAGGFKRVFAVPESGYAIALPNKSKGFGNIEQWRYALEEARATTRYVQEVQQLANPDVFITEATFNESGVVIPALVMRSWSSFTGTVLDAKNTLKHKEEMPLPLEDPTVEIDEIRARISPAVEDVEQLIEDGIWLGRDQLNLVAGGERAVTRVFASEVTDATLERRKLDYVHDRGRMAGRVIDAFFGNCIDHTDYYAHSRDWENLIKRVAESYDVEWY